MRSGVIDAFLNVIIGNFSHQFWQSFGKVTLELELASRHARWVCVGMCVSKCCVYCTAVYCWLQMHAQRVREGGSSSDREELSMPDRALALLHAV